MPHDTKDDHGDERFDEKHEERKNDDFGNYADIPREIDL
jgi:hypothetical protein